MARLDISTNPTIGEIDFINRARTTEQYQFSFLHFDALYWYGEIVIPVAKQKSIVNDFEIRTAIGYKPAYLPLRVRLAVEHNPDNVEYILNPTNNSQWYDITHNSSEVRLSEFRNINNQDSYNLIVCNGTLELYSGNETDLEFTEALSQNQSGLLNTSAGTLYQYPTTGVGLIDFLHGNFENTGLAQKLQSEFQNDGMTIINASMNSETGELSLEIIENNG